MSSIGGYRSPVNIGIGQVPLTTDPELFSEFTEVYNAIHLLNQYLDQLRTIAEGGGGSGQSPADSMPFNRFYTAPAIVGLLAGEPVSPSSVPGQNGIVKGCLANSYTSAAPTANFCGVCLVDTLAGEDTRVGIGPGIITMPAARSGNIIWAYSAMASNGNLFGDSGLYIGNPGPKTVGINTAYPAPVATCPVDGFILFGQYIAR